MEWETAPHLTNCMKRCVLQLKKKQKNKLRTRVFDPSLKKRKNLIGFDLNTQTSCTI